MTYLPNPPEVSKLIQEAINLDEVSQELLITRYALVPQITTYLKDRSWANEWQNVLHQSEAVDQLQAIWGLVATTPNSGPQTLIHECLTYTNQAAQDRSLAHVSLLLYPQINIDQPQDTLKLLTFDPESETYSPDRLNAVVRLLPHWVHNLPLALGDDYDQVHANLKQFVTLVGNEVRNLASNHPWFAFNWLRALPAFILTPKDSPNPLFPEAESIPLIHDVITYGDQDLPTAIQILAAIPENLLSQNLEDSSAPQSLKKLFHTLLDSKQRSENLTSRDLPQFLSRLDYSRIPLASEAIEIYVAYLQEIANTAISDRLYSDHRESAIYAQALQKVLENNVTPLDSNQAAMIHTLIGLPYLLPELHDNSFSLSPLVDFLDTHLPILVNLDQNSSAEARLDAYLTFLNLSSDQIATNLPKILGFISLTVKSTPEFLQTPDSTKADELPRWVDLVHKLPEKYRQSALEQIALVYDDPTAFVKIGYLADLHYDIQEIVDMRNPEQFLTVDQAELKRLKNTWQGFIDGWTESESTSQPPTSQLNRLKYLLTKIDFIHPAIQADLITWRHQIVKQILLSPHVPKTTKADLANLGGVVLGLTAKESHQVLSQLPDGYGPYYRLESQLARAADQEEDTQTLFLAFKQRLFKFPETQTKAIQALLTHLAPETRDQLRFKRQLTQIISNWFTQNKIFSTSNASNKKSQIAPVVRLLNENRDYWLSVLYPKKVTSSMPFEKRIFGLILEQIT